MVRVAVLGVFFLAAAAAVADDVPFDDWALSWNVARHGKIVFQLEQNQDGLRCFILGDHAVFATSPKDAQAVGVILGETESRFAKLTASVGGVEKVKTEKSVVLFSLTDAGFGVSVQRADAISGVYLNRKEVAAIAPKMARAVELADVLKKKMVGGSAAVADALISEAAPPAKEAAATAWRSWSDATGKFTVDARAVSSDGVTVSLQRRDGETVTIALNRLSASDRAEVRRLFGR